jgi:hypothetical protein
VSADWLAAIMLKDPLSRSRLEVNRRTVGKVHPYQMRRFSVPRLLPPPFGAVPVGLPPESVGTERSLLMYMLQLLVGVTVAASAILTFFAWSDGRL